MRRFARISGAFLVVAGAGALAWALTVWQWQDPLTLLLNELEQRELADAFDGRLEESRDLLATSTRPADLSASAIRWRKSSRRGDAVARITIPSIGLEAVVVNGTDPDTLKRGPGRYLGSAMPGEGELVYVAGHRTTYGAPFSKIDRLGKGDRVRVELPYATFEYAVTGRRIVAASEVSVLKSKGLEQLALQACHPRFFATQRIIVYAKPVSVSPAERPATAEAAG